MEAVSNVFAALLGLISVVVGFVGASLWRRARPSAPTVDAGLTLEARLDALAEVMRESARLLAQVSGEIDARAAAATRLQVEAQEAERLAKLNQEERDAVVRVVRAEIAGETKKSTRQNLLASVLFFIAGVAASIAVTLFVRPFA